MRRPWATSWNTLASHAGERFGLGVIGGKHGWASRGGRLSGSRDKVGVSDFCLANKTQGPDRYAVGMELRSDIDGLDRKGEGNGLQYDRCWSAARAGGAKIQGFDADRDGICFIQSLDIERGASGEGCNPEDYDGRELSEDDDILAKAEVIEIHDLEVG